MNNEQYIRALKRALGNMEQQSSDDIIREIQSHVQETDNSQSLIERFGDPEELAKQYLDGEPIAPPRLKRAGSVGKKILIGLGASTALIIATVIVLYWTITGDKFNYADENAKELHENSGDWVSQNLGEKLTLEIEQAQVAIYWHDEKALKWKCKGRDISPPPPGQPLVFRHSSCLIYLPLRAASISTSQSSIVLVRPQAKVSLDIKQSKLRIAENDTGYRYDIKAADSHIADFQSNSNAHLEIVINAVESTVKAYQYE